MTGSITRTCRTCARTFTPVSKARYCSEECRHGTDAGYNSGCRCTPCTRAHSRARNLHRMQRSPWVPAVGTHRRIQALACLGWSSAELSRRLGRHRSYLRKVMTNQHLEIPTVLTIRDLYDELSMTWCTTPTANRTAADARRRGWAPPLGWDDDTIDDPTATPSIRVPGRDVDEVAVARVLGGEWRLPTTRAEKTAVVTRWTAGGGSLRELELLTGWNTSRYTTRALVVEQQEVA